MFTFFDVMTVLMPIAGVLAGVAIGSFLGIVGSICGGVIGFVFGLVAGRLPLILVLRSIRQGLSRQSTDSLRQLLRRGDSPVPHLVLRELASRGEDIRSELDVVLQLLESDSVAQRRRGWMALKAAYPALAAKAAGYHPRASADQCNLKTKMLREMVR